MIFETIIESSNRKELMCPYFLRYHLRKDGQLTIYELWVTPELRHKGVAFGLLNDLKKITGVKSIFAKCPQDLSSNHWYKFNDFVLEGTEKTKNERTLNLWRLIV